MDKKSFKGKDFSSDNVHLRGRDDENHIDRECCEIRECEVNLKKSDNGDNMNDNYDSSRKIINKIVVELFKNILNIQERALQVRGIKDLTMSEMHAIEAIGDGKGKRMSEVASNLDLTMGTLTATLIKLEKKGYALRARDSKDKRIVIASLTKKGRLANKIHTNFHEEMIDHLMIDLRLDQDETLMRALENINEFFLKEYGGIHVS